MRYFVLLLFFLAASVGTTYELFAADEDPTNAQKATSQVENFADDKAFDKAVMGTRAPWLSPDGRNVEYLPQPQERERKIPKERNLDDWDVSWIAAFLKVLYWTVCAVAVVALAFIIVRYVRIRWGSGANSWKWKEALNRERRLETLAPEARARFDDLLEAAKDALERKNYRDALIFYFSWMLVELDKREFVFLDKGKTNMEYLRELDGVEPLRSIYRATMREFERVYYGGRPISDEEFDVVWNLRESFESTMREKDAEIEERNKTQASNVSRVLLSGTLVFACLLSGCREKTWRSGYALPTTEASYSQYSEKSLNGDAAFRRYCRSKRYSITTADYRPLDGKKLDAVVVFLNSDEYLGQTWDLSPLASNSSQPTSEQRLETLQKYAASTDDDWNRLARPRAFQICYQEIEEWLKAKEGRTFVWVLPGHNYELEYWKAARERLVAENPKRLEECDGQIESLDVIEKSAKSAIVGELAMRRQRAEQLLAQEAKKQEETTSESEAQEPTDNFPMNGNISFEPGSYFTDDDFVEHDFRKTTSRVSTLCQNERNQEENNARKLFTSQRMIAASTSAIEPRVELFSGDPSWTKNLPKEGKSTETRRLEAQDSLETLLALGNDVLVQRLPVEKSQVLVVNSTSFLSNYALLDPTNRAIAARLTDEFKQNGRIAFCYGGFGGFGGSRIPQFEEERGEFSLTELSPFTIFIWHVVALTTLLFCYFFPIMGRARRMRRERVEDFGLHIDATARLLKNTGGVEWASRHIDTFRASDRTSGEKRF